VDVPYLAIRPLLRSVTWLALRRTRTALTLPRVSYMDDECAGQTPQKEGGQRPA
jgi:hypothetical protein